MGSRFSKNPGLPINAGATSNATTSAAAAAATNGTEYASELNSYEAACREDPDLQSFDSTLHQRTTHLLSSLTAGDESGSLSFDTLRELTGCLLDMNHDAVDIILACKKDIWNNPALFDLVQDYFDATLHTLDFCTALEKSLHRARDSQLILLVALQRFQEEAEVGKKFERTLEELRLFKAAANPFAEEFFQAFQSVHRRQVSMLEKLQRQKKKLDKKLKTVKAWRKVTNVIFVSAFAAVLICSVVAATMAAPPVAAALAAASAIPLGSMGKWIDSLWKNYSDALRGQREVISTMQVATYVAISDLDSIRVLVDRLDIQMSSMMQNVDFAMRDEGAVQFGIEEIKKKLAVFMKSVEDLGQQADRCSRDIRRARTVVLQRIIRHPK